jgi:hypothetical protein
MFKVTTPVGKFGPYSKVETLEDRYRCDNADLPFTVVGTGVIEEALPDDFPPQVFYDYDQIQRDIVESTQKRLDDFAMTRDYSSIMSLCTYVTSTVEKFRTEGQYGVLVRDQTWQKLYEIMDDVKTGNREHPKSFSEIESELPVLIWSNV